MEKTIPNAIQEMQDANLFILIVSVVLLVGITVFMIYCVVKYSRKKNPTPAKIEGHLGLEITWSVIPTILVMIMFYWGLIGFQSMRAVPKGARVIKVYGKQWEWVFEYANGKKVRQTKEELPVMVVPKGEPIKCLIYSKDVLHSFYIPHFKVKEDAVPGMETYLWFYPDKKGEYDIFCAEYCGDNHSFMLARLRVVDPEDFRIWYNKKDIRSGEDLVQGCMACHSTDGSKRVGPTFKGLFGKKEVVITDGKERSLIVDEKYIRESIQNPEKDKVKGFENIKMTPQDLSDKEITAVIQYLKKLK